MLFALNINHKHNGACAFTFIYEVFFSRGFFFLCYSRIRSFLRLRSLRLNENVFVMSEKWPKIFGFYSNVDIGFEFHPKIPSNKNAAIRYVSCLRALCSIWFHILVCLSYNDCSTIYLSAISSETFVQFSNIRFIQMHSVWLDQLLLSYRTTTTVIMNQNSLELKADAVGG